MVCARLITKSGRSGGFQNRETHPHLNALRVISRSDDQSGELKDRAEYAGTT